MEKNSFVLYLDYMEALDILTMEQRGILITALFNYVAGTELPEMEQSVKVAFSIIKKNIDRDCKKYEEMCERQRAKAYSRWSKNKNNNTDVCHGMPRDTTECQVIPSDAYNDIDNDMDNDIDNDIKKRSSTAKKGAKSYQQFQKRTYDFDELEKTILSNGG